MVILTEGNMAINKSSESMSPSEKKHDGIDSVHTIAKCITIRFLVAFLAFIGFTFNYMLRV